MDNAIPILCELTDPELERRRKVFLEKTGRLFVDFDELENGFRYRYRAEDEVLPIIAEIINLERKCCPFIDFRLLVNAGSNTVALELTGGDGAKEAINELFNRSLPKGSVES